MTLQQLLPILVPALVIAMLLRRANTSRRLHPGRLWIMPVLLTVLIGTGLYFNPHPAPTLVTGVIFAAALALGVLTGTLRARSLVLHHNDEGQLMARTSKAAVVLLGGVIALRYAASHYATGMGHDVTAVAIDASMLFAWAMIVSQRFALWQRARAFTSTAGLALTAAARG